MARAPGYECRGGGKSARATRIGVQRSHVWRSGCECGIAQCAGFGRATVVLERRRYCGRDGLKCTRSPSPLPPPGPTAASLAAVPPDASSRALDALEQPQS